MLTTLRQRHREDEDGFTLIELMVVVLIIAILIAIAIPTFLGAQNRARDRGTQSDLRNGMTAAKTVATDNAGLMTNVDTSALTTAEGALTFAGTGTATAIGVVKSTGDSPVGSTAILLYKQSASGTWYGIQANSNGSVGYCKGAAPANVNAMPCNGTTW
jgi:type IV pilus assembly protein PilA